MDVHKGIENPTVDKKNLFLVYSSALMSAISFLMLAKLQSVSSYASLSIGVALGGILSALMNFGSDRLLVKYLVSGVVTPGLVLSQYLGFRVFLQIVTSLFFFTLYIFNYYGTEVLLVMFWATLVGMYPKGYFDYKKRVICQNSIIFGEKSAFLIIVFAIGNYDLSVVFTLAVFVRIFSLLAQYHFSEWPCLSIGDKPVNSWCPRMYEHLVVTVATVSSAFILFGGQLLSSGFFDSEQTASVGLAIQLTMVVQLFQMQFVRYNSKEINTVGGSEYLKSLNIMLLSLLGRSIKICSVPFLIALLLSEVFTVGKYPYLMDLMPVYILWLIILGPGMVISQGLIAHDGVAVQAVSSVLGGIVTILIVLFFAEEHGVFILPLSLLIGHALAISYQYRKLVSKIA